MTAALHNLLPGHPDRSRVSQGDAVAPRHLPDSNLPSSTFRRCHRLQPDKQTVKTR